MNTKRMRLVPALALLVLAAAVGSVQADDGRTKDFDFSGGGRLELDFRQGGSARIEGWDKDIVRVTWSDDCNDLDVHDVEIEVAGRELTITAESERRLERNCLHFEIMAPRDCDLDFESAGGSLRLTNLEGRFDGRSGGGELELRGLKGRARLTTGGGQVEVVDCELEGDVRTGGGEVLLKNVTGGLEAKSGGGEVRYVNVRGRGGDRRGPASCGDLDITEETVLISNAGGSIVVREAPAGACVRTGGGRVSVRRADRFVVAATGGGDVDVEIASGPVDVSTGAGDVEVFVFGDAGGDVEIRSGLGSIELTVPKGFGAELDLEICYTRSSRQDYRIDSDLPFDEERTDRWVRENGGHDSPKKYIYGTGTVGDGAHRIVIRTTNGDITVRER